jgi:peptide chain release factor 1
VELLIERLDRLKSTYDGLMAELAKPEVASDHVRYAQIAKKAGEIEEAVRTYEEYRAARREADEARDLLRGAAPGEEEDFYRSESAEAASRTQGLEGRLVELVTPRDPRNERAVIVEIRAGAGGDEAALFAGDLLRMYQRYAERQGWKADVLDASDSAGGGVKEVVFEIRGKGAFSKLQHESGVHRVQRVPVTESSGRIHTSTSTVAILPEADEVDVQVDPEDLRIDYFRASGPGGQHVNTTDSAVRITHKPTNIVVSMQSERSQRQNRDRAMRVLLAKLNERAEQEAHEQMASSRRSQVGSGERSEKIRTYNYPQNRITDHRIGFTVHGLPQVLDGALDDIVDALAKGMSEDDDANG